MKPSKNPRPSAHNYYACMLHRQSEYHICCQRTSAHRFDCSESTKRENGPVWRPR